MCWRFCPMVFAFYQFTTSCLGVTSCLWPVTCNLPTNLPSCVAPSVCSSFAPFSTSFLSLHLDLDLTFSKTFASLWISNRLMIEALFLLLWCLVLTKFVFNKVSKRSLLPSFSRCSNLELIYYRAIKLIGSSFFFFSFFFALFFLSVCGCFFR